MGVLKSDLFVHATANAHDGGNISEETRNSPSWRDMKDVNARLEQCATQDFYNIKPAPRAKGPHVTMIHLALEQLSKARTFPVPPPGAPESAQDRARRKYNAAVKAAKDNPIADAEQKASEYGPSTAKAVFAYKKARDIKRPGRPVDNVVGIMTIKALDRDILIAAGAEPPTDPNEEPTLPTKVKFRDVIVAISMTPHRKDEGITTIKQLHDFVFERVVSDEYSNKKDRKLEIQALFADATEFSITNVVNSLKSFPLEDGQQLGKVMMYGISFGGVQVIKVAQRSSGTINIAYLGVSDGAFFDDDTQNKPEGKTDFGSRTGTPTNTPLMNPSFSVTARQTVNLFQISGNLFKVIGLVGERMWFSNMDGAEIHGKLPGFTVNDDVLKDSPTTEKDHTELHKMAAKLGEERILGDMKSILRGVQGAEPGPVEGRSPRAVQASRSLTTAARLRR
jgi:hypothetical protein